MGNLQSEHPTANCIQFKVSLNATLLPLFNEYKAAILFLKTSRVFVSKSRELQQLVKDYIKDPISYNKSDMALCVIDATRKIFNLFNQNEQVNQEKLILACLRHRGFAMEYHWQDLHFQESFRRYLQFLYLCYNQPGDLIIPNRKERFMWHAHRLDRKGYRIDMLKLFKHLLEEDDKLSPEEMAVQKSKTKQFRKFYLPAFRESKSAHRRDHQLKEQTSSSDG